jgi:capsular exopolysaccharide synthesis family protein
MSRIADALKRAEQERQRSLGSGPNGPSGAVATLPPIPRAEHAAPRTDESEPAAESVETEAPPPVASLSESLVPFYERSSLVTEQYRSLRTRLLSQNPNYEHRIIAITSALPKEGKSVTSLNLGCILGEIHHLKVLVVDGDFRRSSLARMLKQDEGPGLAEVLAGLASYEEIQRSTPIPNLTFMPAGSTHGRSAAELLTDSRTKSIFKRMQNDFHYTIVDTPPLTTVTDMGIIGPMCHGAIVVVRLHRTVEPAARRAVRLLQVNNIPILGCLLVGRDGRAGRYGYGYNYNYGYYYRYYNYYSKKDDRKR